MMPFLSASFAALTCYLAHDLPRWFGVSVSLVLVVVFLAGVVALGPLTNTPGPMGFFSFLVLVAPPLFMGALSSAVFRRYRAFAVAKWTFISVFCGYWVLILGVQVST